MVGCIYHQREYVQKEKNRQRKKEQYNKKIKVDRRPSTWVREG